MYAMVCSIEGDTQPKIAQKITESQNKGIGFSKFGQTAAVRVSAPPPGA